MDKWIKIADYVMSSKFDKFAFVTCDKSTK